MPRASNSAKRHQGATNQRDTRHENGLVGPGKRVTKQKSQTQLDGGARSALDNASVPPVPSVPIAANGSTAYPDDMAPEHKAADLLRRGSLGTYSESSSTDSLSASAAHAVFEEAHRRIDVNDAKNNNVHRDPGPLDLVITVLRSCPLQDTIAILIILMQASPAVLTGIYMLFTCLTFVPPVTTSSGLSVAEIFDGSQGTPSLTTLICMDVIMLLIWLFLWAPMQQFILDLAQVVISLTLGGGGGSTRQGTTSNIVLCVAIVGVSQWSQYAKWNGFSRLTNTIFGSNRFLSPSGDQGVRAFDKKGPYGWIRSVLAIHILTQGLVRCIREWYLRRERRDLQSQGLLDPESGKSVSFPTEGSSDVALMAADSDAHLQTSVAHLSNKKRRKQSAQVRIRQPLWAALASTKIVMVKEYELQHATNESAGSNATDIHNLGNATFHAQPEQIWVCYVGCDEVCFNTSHFPDVGDKEAPQEDSKPGVDVSKPFYVKVNNAIWQPTRIIPIENPEEENYQGTRWTGDIYGLTPLSNYECEFVSTRTGQVLFSTSVRTVPAKSKDPEATPKTASNARTHMRHDSPATTLRASIAAAEVKLADEKSRLKAVRKDNNRKLNSVRKEIEKLSSAVHSAGGDDEKLRQKVAQNKIQEKRAEESTRELEAQLKELETMPEGLVQEQRAKHNAWTSEKAKFDRARADFKSFKASIGKQIKSLEEENASLLAKRNKIAARIAKVDDEHARITDANARGLNEAERRRQERAELQAELARAEQNINERIQAMRAANAAKQAQVHDMATQMQAYLASFQDDLTATAQPANPYAPQPPPPASMHWGAPPPPAAAHAAQYTAQPVWPPVSSLSAQVTPLMAHAKPSAFSTPAQVAPALGTPPPTNRTRGRSSSMLSNVSGFTQSTDDDDEHDSGSLNNTGTVVGGGHSGGHHQYQQQPQHHQYQNQYQHHWGGSAHASNALGAQGSLSSAAATAAVGSHLRSPGVPPPGFHVKGAGSAASGSGSGSGSSGSAGSAGSGFGSGPSSVRSGSGSGASLGGGEAGSPV